MLKIEKITVGGLEENCYFLINEKEKYAAVVDPGDEGERIFNAIKRYGVEVLYIINTHGHMDHIGANLYIKEKTGAQILIHPEDAPMLTNAHKNLSVLVGDSVESPAADGLLEDGMVIELGEEKIEVRHTPGHTKGGICLITSAGAITGDTLFAGSIGRTDLQGGSLPQLLKSIKEQLLTLPEDTIIYPGHGPSSTIGFEKKNNVFLLWEANRE
jgi:glyoxylase-like metal-dependent hydrolase (beta-lactamase superfamily II)